MNHEFATLDGNHQLLKHLNFQKKLLFLCLIIRNILLMNKKI
jgi:hypothetical protein